MNVLLGSSKFEPGQFRQYTKENLSDAHGWTKCDHQPECTKLLSYPISNILHSANVALHSRLRTNEIANKGQSQTMTRMNTMKIWKQNISVSQESNYSLFN